MTSDRQHDAFDNTAKMACREGNLRVLREAAYLLWEDGDRRRLRCDWCELMGETGLRTLDLLEREGVLRPGGFVGVDLDRDVWTVANGVSEMPDGNLLLSFRDISTVVMINH